MARERRNSATYWRHLHSAEVVVKCHFVIFTFHSNLGSPVCQPNSLTWTEAEVLFFWNTILWLCLYSLCLNYLFSNVFPQHTTHRETVKKTSQSTNKMVWSFILQPLLVFKSLFFSLSQANSHCFERLYPFEVKDALCIGLQSLSAISRKLIVTLDYVFCNY